MITELDFLILNFVRNNLSCGVADAVMKFITRLGDFGAIWIIIAVALICFKKTRRAGLCLGLVLVVYSLVGNTVLKNIFQRPRPFRVADVPLIISPPGGYSFPSGHTGASFAAATAISVFYKKWTIPVYITAVLIAFSRIYLYVHYPSDVVGGMVLGMAIGYVLAKKQKEYKN